MPLYIHNLRSGDVLTYSLPILVGDVRPSAVDTVILVHNKHSNSTATSWPVIDSKFKLLVDLLPGENELELCCANDVTVFTLHLISSKLTNFVRPIYICCRDDAGEFQGPDDEDRSPSSAVRRIALAARLVIFMLRAIDRSARLGDCAAHTVDPLSLTNPNLNGYPKPNINAGLQELNSFAQDCRRWKLITRRAMDTNGCCFHGS